MNRHKILLLLFTLSHTVFFAQERTDTVSNVNLNKSVIVVTNYQPSVSDATKINQLPQVDDTVTVNPNFQYSIESKPVSTYYSLKQIQAARLKGEPLQPLYKALTEVGFGNYYTTFAGLKYNSLRSRNYQLGVDMYHFSQQGKARLANDEKVPAGHSTNYVKLYGKKFVNDLIVSGGLNFRREVANRYGYYTADSIMEFAYDTVNLEKDDIKQIFYMNDFYAGFKSKALDSSRLHYNVNLKYEYTTPRAAVQEHGVGVDARIFKYVKDLTIAGDIALDYYKLNRNEDDSLYPGNTTFTFSPWAETATTQWKAMAGFSIVNVWGNDQFHFYPNIAFDLNIADNIVIPYVRYSGWLESNNYRDIALENPYILDSLRVKATSYQNVFKGGIRGSISKHIPFNISVGYSDINNMYLYVNDYVFTDSAQNMFDVVYDDVNILSIHGETGFQKGEKISIIVSADYYNYDLETEKKAWHKPSFQFGISGRYNMQDKVIANIEANYIGGLYAKNPFDSSAVKMNNIFDINMKIEYKYTKVLSAFLKFNNIIASRYSIWNQYPAYRFTAMIGVTYALGKEKN